MSTSKKEPPTFPQMNKLHCAAVDKGVGPTEMQALLASGIMPDIFEAAAEGIVPRRTAVKELLNYSGLLEPLKIISTKATREFVVGDRFRMGRKDVRFTKIDPDFVEHFSRARSYSQKAGSLVSFTLTEPALDLDIIMCLGHRHANVPIGYVLDLLLAQPNGEPGGDLLATGMNNLFFVNDEHYETRKIVVAKWENGWRLHDSSIALGGSVNSLGYRVFAPGPQA